MDIIKKRGLSIFQIDPSGYSDWFQEAFDNANKCEAKEDAKD